MHFFKPSIAVTRTMVSVEAAYNPEFKRQAAKLGGVFKDKKWYFSYQEEIEVRKATEKCYGYDGLVDPVRADVKVTFKQELFSQANKSVDILARPIARVSNKSDEPLTAPGTLIESGSITTVGQKVRFEKGTKLILRSVPVTLIDHHKQNPAYDVERIPYDNQALEILFHEYEQLVKRANELRMLLDHSDKDIDQFNQIIEQRNAQRMVAGNG